MLTTESPVCIACRNGKDKALHDLIASDILPQLIESAAARRRAEEKQAAIEAMPKKRSSRLQVQCLLFLQCCLVLSAMQSGAWPSGYVSSTFGPHRGFTVASNTTLKCSISHRTHADPMIVTVSAVQNNKHSKRM